jgi:hypothetical protein
VDTVGAEGAALDLYQLALYFPHPGVKQLHLAICHHGTSGKTAVQVVLFTGCQGHRQVFPGQEVLGAGMSPVHGAPSGSVGVVLVENVVVASVRHQAAGIVHPLGLGHEVIVEAEGWVNQRSRLH